MPTKIKLDFETLNNIYPDLDTTVGLKENQYLKFGNKCTLLDTLKEVNIIRTNKGTFLFNEDKWSFEKETAISSIHRIINFSNCPDKYKDTLKTFVFSEIFNSGNNIGTCKSLTYNFIDFFKYLEKNNILSFDNITYENIFCFLNQTNNNISNKNRRVSQIKRFIIFYNSIFNKSIPDSIVKRLDALTFGCRNAEKISSKRSYIPSEYFDPMISSAIKEFNDASSDIDIRIKDAVIIIFSQTGIREWEMSNLSKSCINEYTNPAGGKFYSITYKRFKSLKNDEFHLVEAPCNDLTRQAVIFLVKACSRERKKQHSNLLIVLKHNNLPLMPTKYSHWITELCLRNRDNIPLTDKRYKNILSKKLNHNICRQLTNPEQRTFKQIYSNNPNAEAYFPLCHQFRNTFVQVRIDKGESVESICNFLDHSDTVMTMGYYNTQKKIIEDNSLKTTIIKDIFEEDIHPLGLNGEKFYKEVENLIKNENLNIVQNFDEAKKKIDENLPIRAKSGGFCIKGARFLSGCENEAKSDSFICGLDGQCSKEVHFYFNIDSSYADLLNAIDSYKRNHDEQYIQDTEKDFNKVKAIIKNRVEPELKQLKQQIKKLGMKDVLSRHPNLESVIYKTDEIERIIEEWKSKQFEPIKELD